MKRAIFGFTSVMAVVSLWVVIEYKFQHHSFEGLPLVFEANRGQIDINARFLARGYGYTLFFTETETVFAAAGEEPVRMKLIGSNPATELEGREELPGKSSYFIGSDPSKWRTGIPQYAKVGYRSVYPGIDLVYYGDRHQIEHDFVVEPGADPRQIQFQVTTAQRVELDRQGELVIHLRDGELRQRKPMIYQGEGSSRKEVAGGYRLINNQISFELGPYDATQPLVIDPVVVFSTYLGGSGSEAFGTDIGLDAAGNIYLTGPTNSLDFPTQNPLQPKKAGQSTANNAFVAKLSADGTHLIYSTYIGGSNNDGRAIAVDGQGNAMITGRTNSSDFPITENAAQRTFGGGPSDGFVVKLSADGAKLLYSSYLGGSGTDNGNYLSVDGQGNAVVVGATNSNDFPTVSAAQSQSGGGFDGFVVRLSSDGRIVYSTYLGGDGEDRANLSSTDSQGNVLVSGRTASANFPTRNALQRTHGGGGFDAFLAKLDPAGKIAFSTYLGGSGADSGGATAVDGLGNIYFTGTTNSTDFPLVRALQTRTGGGTCASPPRPCYDAFVAKFTSDGSSLIFSTYLGGNGEENTIDARGAIGVDAAGFAYVVGYTSARDFPSVNPLQQTYGGGPFDSFITEFSPDGSVLIYSTILGGSGDEEPYEIKVDPAGAVYVGGYTTSTDLPTSNAMQPAYGGGPSDAFVTKISQVEASGVFYFAQAGGGGGFSTVIALTNPSTTRPVTGTVSFFGSNGQPLNGIAANAGSSFVIAPLRTAIVDTNRQGTMQSAYALVTTTEPVLANGTYALPGLPLLSVRPSRTGSLFVTSISRRKDLVEPAIAFVNISRMTARLSLSLLDSSGRVQGEAILMMPPGEQISRFLWELIPGIPDRFAGTLQARSLGNPLGPPAMLAGTVLEFRDGRLHELAWTN